MPDDNGAAAPPARLEELRALVDDALRGDCAATAVWYADKLATLSRGAVEDELRLARAYFGEKVALYFMWLGCYTKWLMYATLAGFIAWIQISSERDDYSVELVPVFATFLAVWSTLFLEHWKRCQVRKAMEWGMTGFEEQEEERPEFTFDRDVITISSPVNGQPYSYFPLWRQQELRAQAQVVITTVLFLSELRDGTSNWPSRV